MELVGKIDSYSTKDYLGDDIYVGYYGIPETDWHLVSSLSSNSLTRKGISLVIRFLCIYIGIFLFAFFLSVSLSQSIARRLSDLNAKMKEVHNGRPKRIETHVVSNDEIGDLANTYNFMSDEINKLMDKQAEDAEELKLMEYRALQSQINPHFLYNSLDMINWLSRQRKSEEATKAIQALSKFYKLTLSGKNEKVTVEKELEHISLYVKLQNMRYENHIELIVDVPDSIIGCQIPKLTLQPLIENSINHGIMEKSTKKGSILVTGWPEDTDFVLLVSDDGVGMSEEELDLILKKKVNENEKGTNIGVYNTHMRIKLLYGAKYGLRYESAPGNGTEVSIRLPAIYKW